MINIGVCQVDLATGLVINSSEETVLSPRLHALLNYLVSHPNQLIERDDLIEAVWGHIEAASDDSVNVAMSGLRRALGDSNRPHRYIQTIPRRGYRFHWDPQEHSNSDPKPPTEVAVKKQFDSYAKKLAYLGVVVAVSLLLRFLAEILFIEEYVSIGEPHVETQSQMESSIDTLPSIAVMPFKLEGVDSAELPWAGGLSDRIISLLASTDKMRVSARASSVRYKERETPIKEIGRKLGVANILVGDIQKSNSDVRIIARLIDVKSQSYIWSAHYDLKNDGFFKVQDEIANKVSQALTSALLPKANYLENLSVEGYGLIAKARIEIDQNNSASARRAIGYLDQVIEFAPNNVEALVLRYDAEQTLNALSSTPSDQSDDSYLQHAISLAPNNPNVLRAQGVRALFKKNYEKAVSFLNLAIHHEPNNAEAYATLGRVLFRQAKYQDSLEALRDANALNPLSERVVVWLADSFWAVGQSEEAVYQLRESIERSPQFAGTYDRLSTYLAQLGKVGEAMLVIKSARNLDPESSYRWFRECEFYLQIGDDRSAEACTDQLESEHELPIRLPYLRQIIAGFRGDEETKRTILWELVEKAPDSPLIPGILADSLAMDRCNEALEVIQRFYPSLFSDEPRLNTLLIYPATTALFCLQETQQHNRSTALMTALEKKLSRVRLERGPWLINGIEHAKLMILQNKTDEALIELERVVNNDWRYYWWGLNKNAFFKRINHRPEFKKIVEKLERGVQRERNYFERQLKNSVENGSPT